MSETNNAAQQFLTFRLNPEQYGINVLQVREVLEVPDITMLPRMPAYMRGVINIRGLVMPVIDLRLKLGLSAEDKSIHSRVIIIESEKDGLVLVLGILVDAVHEVIDIAADQISPPPTFGAQVDNVFMKGIARVNEEFVVILDLQQIFSSDADLVKLAEGAKAMPAGVGASN